MDTFDEFVLDAVSGGETEFDYGAPADAQRLLTKLNWEIEPIIEHHGLEPVGDAIWYLYGCVSGMTHDARRSR